MYRVAGRVLTLGLLASIAWSVASLPLSGYTEALFPLLLALATCLYSRRSVRQVFRISRPEVKDIIAPVALGLAVPGCIMAAQFIADLATNGALSRFLERFPSPPSPEFPLLAVFIGGIVLPTLEELFFRGFMLSSFEPEVFGVGGQIWISSLVFTLLHPVAGMPAALLISVFASQAVIDSGSILPAIVLHSMNNIVGQSLDSLYQSNTHAAVAVALGIAVVGITLAYLRPRDFRHWFDAIHQSFRDFVANLRDTLRKVLHEWSYIVLSVVILLNIIAFFVPGQ